MPGSPRDERAHKDEQKRVDRQQVPVPDVPTARRYGHEVHQRRAYDKSGADSVFTPEGALNERRPHEDQEKRNRGLDQKRNEKVVPPTPRTNLSHQKARDSS